MKACKLKKKPTVRRPVYIMDFQGSLPKPKIPLLFISKINKPKVFIEFVFDDTKQS